MGNGKRSRKKLRATKAEGSRPFLADLGCGGAFSKTVFSKMRPSVRAPVHPEADTFSIGRFRAAGDLVLPSNHCWPPLGWRNRRYDFCDFYEKPFWEANSTHLAPSTTSKTKFPGRRNRPILGLWAPGRTDARKAGRVFEKTILENAAPLPKRIRKGPCCVLHYTCRMTFFSVNPLDAERKKKAYSLPEGEKWLLSK